MIVLYLILAAIVLFLAVLVFRAVLVRAKARVLTESVTHETAERQQYYAERLAQMIRCRTISVEGPFAPEEFEKLNGVMKELFPLIHKKARRMTFSDDCWLYCLEGKDPSRNIMLMSHHDVVKADGDWKYPPFGGELHDGAVWGRGTVDTKGALFSEFSALEELLADGWVPPVNIYIGSSHNEELGGDGIPSVRDYFLEKGIRMELILDEGGSIIVPEIPGVKNRCAMLAIHEKGRCTIKCRTEAHRGHASLQPGGGTPVDRMAKFMVAANATFARRMYPEVEEMLKSVCPYMPFHLRLLFANLWCFRPLAVKLLPKMSPFVGGMLGTTLNFKGVHGGKQGDKNEEFCEATAMVRCVDDKDLEQDLAALRRMGEGHGVTVEVVNSEFYPAADLQSEGVQYVEKIAAEVFPGAAVVPFILPAGTDAWRLGGVSNAVVRFSPLELNNQQYFSVHGDNENMDFRTLGNAVAFYRHILKNYPETR